jgi:hypothetical protein
LIFFKEDLKTIRDPGSLIQEALAQDLLYSCRTLPQHTCDIFMPPSELVLANTRLPNIPEILFKSKGSKKLLENN